MENYHYNNMMSSLQNLDLDYGVESVFGASKYSCCSPKAACVGQSQNVHGPQVLDHTNWATQTTNGEPLHAPVPRGPRSFVDTNIFSNQEQVRSSFGPSYDPSYMGGSTLPRSHGQNGNHNQAFTEARSNYQDGYRNQEFTGRIDGPQDIVSMAKRHEGWIFMQNAVVVELVLCMRVMNQILCRGVPQVEAKNSVPRDDQQTPDRISSSALDLPVPTRSKRIFVGGLASTVTESDFMAYFDQFGTITNVEVMHDPFTQRPRGFGFITFDSEKAVDKVLLRTSFHELNGKMAEVKRAIPKNIYRKSIRGQLGALNYGLSRVSNLLSAYTQGHNASQVGGSGLRVDARFGPAAVSGYPSFSADGCC